MQAINRQRESSVNLREFYSSVRTYTEALCKPLHVEDYVPQPIADVSPPKWNIAHTTWFFEEMVLKRFVSGYKVFDERFGFLFNSYYNSAGDRTRRENRGDLSRPTVKEVFEYRRYVDKEMNSFLTQDLTDEIRDLVVLGLNHEQQHQELFSTDLKYILAVNPLFPVYREDFAIEETTETISNGFVEISGGIYEIGFEGEGFCFDNELARHKTYIGDFSISKSLVTNREYLEFILDSGYRDHRLWHSEGWEWVNLNNIDAPLYWHNKDGKRFHFTLSGLRPLPLDAPVCHVSFYEAAAFAEWRGMRLPTESEWETASDAFDWKLRWEWTNSAYLPYPGFTRSKGAVGEYNGKFMVNQMVLRGASVATPGGHSRKTYRNFFHPHLRWQYSGIRLAK